MNPENSNKCEVGGGRCHCHWVRPVSVILIGVAFLLNTFGVLATSTLNIVWPILLITFGSAKLCKCCKGCCK